MYIRYLFMACMCAIPYICRLFRLEFFNNNKKTLYLPNSSFFLFLSCVFYTNKTDLSEWINEEKNALPTLCHSRSCKMVLRLFFYVIFFFFGTRNVPKKKKLKEINEWNEKNNINTATRSSQRKEWKKKEKKNCSKRNFRIK